MHWCSKMTPDNKDYLQIKQWCKLAWNPTLTHWLRSHSIIVGVHQMQFSWCSQRKAQTLLETKKANSGQFPVCIIEHPPLIFMLVSADSSRRLMLNNLIMHLFLWRQSAVRRRYCRRRVSLLTEGICVCHNTAFVPCQSNFRLLLLFMPQEMVQICYACCEWCE